MLHSLILTLMITYKAFVGDLLLGVMPNTEVPESKVINELYKLSDITKNSELPYKITKDLSLLAPVIDAKESLAIDLKSDKVLYSKNAYKRRQIASITKLMTAVLVLEKSKLSDIVTVPSDIATVVGSKINLSPGEKISVLDLLKSMLIHSANDSAYALGEFIGGDQASFVKMMNEKASGLGLINTHFSNSIGLDSNKNYSTAFEIYLITKEFLKYPELRKIVSTKEEVIKTISNKEYKLASTNKNLSSFLKISGVKTGTTDMAGESLVNLLEVGKHGEVVIVVLDSPRRFDEAKILAEWCKRAYQWKDK